jgi:hypothetical protein
MAGSIAPAVIGAAVARTRRRIAEHFLIHEAISPETALAFVPESGIQRTQFSWMQRNGLMHEAGPGCYWLDAPAFAAREEERRRRITLVFAIIFIVLAGVVLFAYRLA